MNKWHIGTIQTASQILESGIAIWKNIGMDTLQVRLGSSQDDEALAQLSPLLGDFPLLTMTVGWRYGPSIWNFTEGPATLGLVPATYRIQRQAVMFSAIEQASKYHIPLVQTHFGFVPEEPGDKRYKEAVTCLREISHYASLYDITFCLETGQETPVTLRRLIEDAGEKNIGINLDPANLLMYGKGNPSDAVDIFGSLIRSMHIKDGDYPTDMYKFGSEHPVGQGRVDFPTIFSKLQNYNFHGPLIIEREITGPQKMKDIQNSVMQLRNWLKEI